MTAHFLGGCTIGGSSQTGVIDPYHRMFGHPGLHVVDGSAISANLGVNPSLTITAQAERAMSYWPNKDQPDPRPADRRRLPSPAAGPAALARRTRRGTRGAAAPASRETLTVRHPSRPALPVEGR